MLAAVLALPWLSGPAGAQTRDRARVAAAVDSLAESALATGRIAGLSVAVVRGRDTLVLKGYGRADLELDVPTPERAVYDIASVTKTFTAAAVMQLVEQGKLALDDDITRHLPDFPTQGHRVTLRHLLGHMSGIRDFVDIPPFHAIERLALPRDTLTRLIAAQPFDFAPGTAMAYDNSGYFLLGLVIERVSGMPYAEYVARNLFARAGMPDSRAASNTELTPRMTHGYALGPDGRLHLPPYLDYTWPFAAGVLRSTAGDLVAWSQALHGGRIVGAAAYREMITPDTLNDGTRLRYAKGIAPGAILGHRALSHGGTLPGFLSLATYLPDDSLTVVVLMNSGGPGAPQQKLTDAIVRVVLGDRTPAPLAFHGRAAEYLGEYRAHTGEFEYRATVVTDSAGRLAMSVDGGAPRPMEYRGGETFTVGPSLQLTFVRARGAVTGMRWVLEAAAFPLARQPAARTPGRGE